MTNNNILSFLDDAVEVPVERVIRRAQNAFHVYEGCFFFASSRCGARALDRERGGQARSYPPTYLTSLPKKVVKTCIGTSVDDGSRFSFFFEALSGHRLCQAVASVRDFSERLRWGCRRVYCSTKVSTRSTLRDRGLARWHTGCSCDMAPASWSWVLWFRCV